MTLCRLQLLLSVSGRRIPFSYFHLVRPDTQQKGLVDMPRDMTEHNHTGCNVASAWDVMQYNPGPCLSDTKGGACAVAARWDRIHRRLSVPAHLGSEPQCMVSFGASCDEASWWLYMCIVKPAWQLQPLQGTTECPIVETATAAEIAD